MALACAGAIPLRCAAAHKWPAASSPGHSSQGRAEQARCRGPRCSARQPHGAHVPICRSPRGNLLLPTAAAEADWSCPGVSGAAPVLLRGESVPHLQLPRVVLSRCLFRLQRLPTGSEVWCGLTFVALGGRRGSGPLDARQVVRSAPGCALVLGCHPRAGVCTGCGQRSRRSRRQCTPLASRTRRRRRRRRGVCGDPARPHTGGCRRDDRRPSAGQTFPCLHPLLWLKGRRMKWHL
jgi:hypothetical protein